MPRNLEIKAWIEHVQRAQSVARSLNATHAGILHQTDTYFKVQQGRLKLREIADSHSELIYYLRDEASPRRESKYEVYRVEDAASLKGILEHALGILATVKKERMLFLYNETRIHIDKVEELGSYLEIEVPVSHSLSASEEILRFLIEKFNIRSTDFLYHSYADMIPGHL
jgi:predicted adenylyl cyclase CyaB